MIQIRYKELKSGKFSIYLDIFSSDEQKNKKRQYEFLKLYVSKDYSKIKNVLTEDKNTIDFAETIRKKREMEMAGDIKGLRTKQKTSQIILIDYLECIMYKNKDWHLKTLIFHLKNFANGKEIRLMDLSPELLIRFQDYLASRVAQNTVYGYIKMLRARMNEAYRKDIITINPFDKYDMPHTLEPHRTTLDFEEVQKLYDTPFPSHPHVRLLFLFSCFTGLRVSDCRALKWNEIISETDNDDNNVHFLKIKPVKTLNSSGKTLKVPLTESAISILDELKGVRNNSEIVFFDFPIERNARNLLKLWAARAGIKKNVHFHVARHSFATISLTFGMDIYTVSKLLGHINLRTTEIYAKIVDEKKRFEIQKLPILQ